MFLTARLKYENLEVKIIYLKWQTKTLLSSSIAMSVQTVREVCFSCAYPVPKRGTKAQE